VVRLILTIAGLFLVWQLASVAVAIRGFPSALDAIAALPDVLSDPDALQNFSASFYRLAAGFLIALVLAVPLGLAMGRYRVVSRLVGPALSLVYPIPKAAIMPILMLWLGIGDLPKILVIALGISLPLVYHSRQGASSVNERMLWAARAFGMSDVRLLLKVVLPAALPAILLGCKTGLVIALIVMIVSEASVREYGIGNILFSALDTAQYKEVYATIILLGAIGLGLDRLFGAIQRYAVSWAGVEERVV
jgi:NitT/TauT family transport system permease protein